MGRRFLQGRRGASMVAYGLLIAVIAVGILAATGNLGSALSRISCGMAQVMGGIAANRLNDGGQTNPCLPVCTNAAVGTLCQRANANGGWDTVVVAQTNSLYVWPSDEALVTWNNGTSNWAVALSPDYTSSGTALADMNGMAETNTLLSAPDSTGTAAPYAAAAACRAHGTDWYLPAMGELAIVTAASGAGTVGSLTMVHSTAGPPYTGYYWSASEYNTNNAWSQYYSGGWQSYVTTKSHVFATRCVRK